MPADLRHIAVHVEEASDGAFDWVLSERHARMTWAEIQRSASATDTYKDAMANGLMALEAMVENLDIGPRASKAPYAGHVSQAPRAVRASQSARHPATGPKPSSEPDHQKSAVTTPFGFGPAV